MRWARTTSAALGALCLLAAGCTSNPPPSTYKAGVLPSITTQQLEALLGKPTSTLPFMLPGVEAQILSYPFGQVAIQHGRVITVTIAYDKQYVGPNGTKLGMSEDDLKAALHKTGKHHRGHRDAYDVIAGDLDTRTKDLYDETDHVMYELAAANANDPLAPYSIISINLANPDGFKFLEAVTKAKLGGMYPGQRVDNFVSDSWTI